MPGNARRGIVTGMGLLISQPYTVVDGREYGDYLERTVGECRRLMGAGRVPDEEALRAFLDDAETVLRQVRRDVGAAESTGRPSVQSQVDFTPQEYRRYFAMGESTRNLLEILEM